MHDLPILQGCSTIQLPKGLNTLVDSDHWRWLNAMTWGIVHAKGGHRYAIHQERRDGELATIKLHRWVACPENGLDVDHRNKDTLDNRRENLRICTRADNNANKDKPRRANATSRFKGVSRRRDGAWVARITRNNRTTSLGYFSEEAAAAAAYDRAAREMHGEFARTNGVGDG